jgi:glutathione S-transferase
MAEYFIQFEHSMKLLYTINSPYARKVRIIAAEKHIDLVLEAVVLSDPDCVVKQYNPLGKVPVLVLENGDALYDSSVIAEYLDKSAPLANLIPVDHSLRIKVKRWEALADGVCDAAVEVMLEQRRSAMMQDQHAVNKQMEKVMRGLNVLNEDVGMNKWCMGGKFTLADIAVGCMLGYVQFRFAEKVNLEKDFPNLARLEHELLKRASFMDTQPIP